MAIQRTRWRPDTCDCVLVYEWDDSVPEDQRTHTGAVVEQACAVHAALKDDPQAHHDAVFAENQLKNVTVHAVAKSLGWTPPQRHPRAPDVIIDPEVAPEFAPSEIAWTFDDKRNLIIDTATLATEAKVDPVALNDAIAAEVSGAASKSGVALVNGATVVTV